MKKSTNFMKIIIQLSFIQSLLYYIFSQNIYSINPKEQIDLDAQTIFVVIDDQINFGYVGTFEGNLLKVDLNDSYQTVYDKFLCPQILNAVFDYTYERLYVICKDQGTKILEINEEGYEIIEHENLNTYYSSWITFSQSSITGDRFMYVQSQNNVQLYDVNDSKNPIFLQELTGIGIAHQIDISPDQKFLFAAQDVLGFAIYDIEDLGNVLQVTQDFYEGTYGVIGLKVHPSKQFVIVLSKFDYVAIVDYSRYYNQQYPVEYYHDSIYLDPSFSEKYDLHLSHDGNSFYITCNGSGIFHVDITDVLNPKLIQIMEQSGIIKKMGLPPINTDFLFLTNSQDLIIYEKITPIFKQNNLFTAFQTELWDGPTKEVWPWTQAITHNNTRYYTMLVIDGIRVYDLTNLPDIVLDYQFKHPIIPGLDQPFHITVDLDDENIIYIGNYNEEGFFIIDATDLSNPIKLASLTFPNQLGYSVEACIHDHSLILVNIRTNMIIVDVSDKTSPQILCYSQAPDSFVITQFRKGKVSNNGRYVYAPDIVLGRLFAFEMSDDHSSMDYIGDTPLQLGYLILISQVNEGIMYQMVNIGGIYIYDISEGVQKLIKLIELDGILWDMQFDKQEHSLFVASAQRNQLMTIDITNPYEATLINIFQFNSEQGIQVTTTFSQQGVPYVILNTFTGIRTIPLDVKAQVNIQVFQYNQTTLQYQVHQNSEKAKSYKFPLFFVGESGKAQFQILNNPFAQKINKFFYYSIDQPTVLQEQTSLFQFDITAREVGFLAQKSNLGVNTVVIQVFTKIFVEDLVTDRAQYFDGEEYIYFPVSEKMANKIINRANQFGYITDDGFPTDSFNIENTLILLDGYQIYSDHLRSIIRQKIEFIPFTFIVKDSLIFNYEYEHSHDYNFQIIQTYAKELEISLKVDPEKAVFFRQILQGVLSSYSEDTSELILQGKTSSINYILDQIKIEVRHLDEIDQIDVVVTIDDGLNKRQIHTLQLQEIKFLKINEHVRVGQSLQDQFDYYYPNSEITLEQEFQFSFKIESFKDDDELQYILEVYAEGEKGKYHEIKQYTTFDNYELNFISSEKMIKGKISRGMYRSTFNFRVTATDEYSLSSQEFILKANIVPFSIIVSYLIIGGSTIISIISGIQYRGYLYGVFCKRLYRYGNVYIQEEEDFLIQITLGKEDLNLAKKQLNLLETYLKNNNMKYEDLIDLEEPQLYNLDREKVKKILLKLSPQLEQDGFQNDHSINFVMLKSFILRKILKKNKRSQKILEQMKSIAIKNDKQLNKLRWFEYFTDVKNNYVQNPFEITPKVYIKLEQVLQVLGKLIEKQPVLNYQFKFNTCYEIENPELVKKIKDLPQIYKDFKIFLILQNLKIETLGYKPYKFGRYTQGQIVTKRTQDIKIARAMVKKKSFFTPFLKYLNLDYTDIPLSQNTPLPQWMDYTCHHNVIEIFGKIPVDDISNPIKQDIVIRIEDIHGYTLKEFHIVQVNHKRKNIIVEQEKDIINDSVQHSVRLRTKSEMIRSAHNLNTNNTPRRQKQISFHEPSIQQQQQQQQQKSNFRLQVDNFDSNSQYNEVKLEIEQKIKKDYTDNIGDEYGNQSDENKPTNVQMEEQTFTDDGQSVKQDSYEKNSNGKGKQQKEEEEILNITCSGEMNFDEYSDGHKEALQLPYESFQVELENKSEFIKQFSGLESTARRFLQSNDNSMIQTGQNSNNISKYYDQFGDDHRFTDRNNNKKKSDLINQYDKQDISFQVTDRKNI